MRALGGVLEATGRDLGVAEGRQTFATEVGSAIGQMLGYVAVNAATGPAGSAIMMIGQGMDIAGDSVDAFEQKTGKEVSDQAEAAAVGLGGLVTGLSEKLQFDWLMRALPKNVQASLTKRLGDILVTGGMEAVQETVEGIGHAAIKKALYDEDAELFPWDELVKEAGIAGTAAAIFRAVLGIKRIRTSESNEELNKTQLDELAKVADGTKAKGLAPERFQALLQGLGEANVYLPAEAAQTLFQGQSEEQIAKTLNVPLDDYLTALATQSDITIPLDHYLTNLDHKTMAPFVRTTPQSMYLDLEDEGGLARAESIARDFNGETDNRIYEEVRQMLVETGRFTESDADAKAKIFQAGFKTLAANSDMDAFDLYQEYGVQIKATLPDALKNSAVDSRLEDLIERVRSGATIEVDENTDDATLQLKNDLDVLREEIGRREIDLQSMGNEEVRAILNPQMDAGGQTLNQNTQRPTTNSKGRPIHPTAEGVKNFWEWFGKSKVVDESGEPLTVYHGATSDIIEFDADRRGENTGAESAKAGFFFTDDTVTAESYANYAATDARIAALLREAEKAEAKGDWDAYDAKVIEYETLDASFSDRSEERRVGKECRSRWSPYH
jgi:hypothetical protein